MLKKVRSSIDTFLAMESLSGIIIIIAALAGILMENSVFSPLYGKLLENNISVTMNGSGIEKPLLLWINDGLMAIFFLLVSLEIKREIMEGELSSVKKMTLPLMAAFGGVIFPALIYWGFNSGDAQAMRGWAIPVATDIAFALCVVSLLGVKLVPKELKTFLLAVAIIDDIAAILIITFFYTADVSTAALTTAGFAVLGLLLLNVLHVKNTTAYLVVGTVLWAAVLKSGVHATIAGVIIGAFIPIKVPNSSESPLKELETEFHPWVVYLVMPIFAFANAGVSLKGIQFSDLLKPIPAGIITGLVVGKIIGIGSGVFLSIKLGLTNLPKATNWSMIIGIGAICGIGFTMSLFIGSLAFTDPVIGTYVRIGVLSGSLIAAAIGSLIFFFARKTNA